jgi:hypothetical protein
MALAWVSNRKQIYWQIIDLRKNINRAQLYTVNQYSSQTVHATSEYVKGKPGEFKIEKQIALDSKTQVLNKEFF